MSMKSYVFALCALWFTSGTWAQTGLFSNGSACGCPSVALRDTVWVTDNNGSGVGTTTWTCDNLYVLTEQVFVNSGDTLIIEPGTAVLGASGSGRQEYTVPANNDVGSVLTVDYDVFPGALVVARGAYLNAEGIETCPIQFTFLGDPLDGSVGLDVQGQWGGVVLCGTAGLNTLPLGGGASPSQTTGLGTGQDRAEGIVDVTGQDRHVYGGNTDSTSSSGVISFASFRHGSTNLGWNYALNGNETDLLQLGGCGSGTAVHHIELIGSADDGMHILGGKVEVHHILSAFHAEDAFETDQGWQGAGQFMLGIQDTAVAHPTNPPLESYVWMMQGDDFEEFNMDLWYEPYTAPWMSNLTLLTNGANAALYGASLPGGDWLNSVVHGVSESGLLLRYSYACDGYAAMLPQTVGGGFGVLRMRNWRIAGLQGNLSNVELGDVVGDFAQNPLTELLLPYLVDSGFTVQSLLTDGDFALSGGVLTDGIDPRPTQGETVSPYYQTLDPRLEEVTYHGAFAPSAQPWFEGWSALSSMGLFSGSASNPGCTYSFACNYDVNATEDDGSCDFSQCAGCTSPWACNYQLGAWIDDGSCERTSCAGCTFVLACNYDPQATQDDGSCTYEECSGCTFEGAPNYDPAALIDDGSCLFDVVGNFCQGDLNGDGVISTLDLLDFLSVYGEVCDP